MAVITTTRLYSILEQKIGRNEAETLTSYIDEKIAEEVKSNTGDIATKDFVKKEIAESKSEIIKWMFIFWVGQLAAMFGLIYFIVKK